MQILGITKEGISRPFGDERTVKEAFPTSALPTKVADPFLLCHYFDSGPSEAVRDPDEFPVNWHPHRGMDVASYLKKGQGRHGDSLGNRGTYETPGMQWMSVGSGVEHAEGGGHNPDGVEGFQLWINVPAANKMDNPRYGTAEPNQLPAIELPLHPREKSSTNLVAATARVLGGSGYGHDGPFLTAKPLQMIDFEVSQSGRVELDVPVGLDTVLLYVYSGNSSLQVGGAMEVSGDDYHDVTAGSVVVFDATQANRRTVTFAGATSTNKTSNTMCAILFAGKKLNESIVWRGPIVMNTQEQIDETFKSLRNGTFPPTRAPWNYKRIAEKPKE